MMVKKKLFELETNLLCHIADMAYWKKLSKKQNNKAEAEINKCFMHLRKIIFGSEIDYFAHAVNLSKIKMDELLGGVNHGQISTNRQGINPKMGAGLRRKRNGGLGTGNKNSNRDKRKVATL